jgi:GntR family transcriptional regulator
MIVVVDPSSGVPVFRQLMDQIRLQIASGLLEPGDELPPTRAMSADLGVNPMTVSKAYNLLEREGLLDRRPGRPLVVAAIGGTQLDAERMDLVTDSLRRAARLVRQLGVGSDEAVAAFEDLLRNQDPSTDRGD